MVERLLRVYLYLTAVLLLLALPCAALPYAWMDSVHRWLGLGALPDEPVVLYLARSASVLYACIGALHGFLASDVYRYRDLLRFLGWLKVVLGLTLLVIDVSAGMPWFWSAGEGPFILAWGLVLVALVRVLPAVPERPGN
jgi:hypothetical protein